MIQVGDTVEFINEKGTYAAADGARAIVTHIHGPHKFDLISVKWVRNGDDNGQEDGPYFNNKFKKVEEVSTQKEDRILIENEKIMTKFEEKNPEQLKSFLEKLNSLVDEFHPNIYTLNDVFKGIQTIEIAILDELNKEKL